MGGCSLPADTIQDAGNRRASAYSAFSNQQQVETAGEAQGPAREGVCPHTGTCPLASFPAATAAETHGGTKNSILTGLTAQSTIHPLVGQGEAPRRREVQGPPIEPLCQLVQRRHRMTSGRAATYAGLGGPRSPGSRAPRMLGGSHDAETQTQITQKKLPS